MKIELELRDAYNLAHTLSTPPVKQLIFDNQTAFYLSKKVIEADPDCTIISEGEFWWTIDGDEFSKCDFQITFETTLQKLHCK